MPEAGDSVRHVVAGTARDLDLELKVAYEVRSISAMKSLVMRGAASAVLPYFAALDEVRAGKLDARPITTMPAIKRTLLLASSKQRGPFKNEAGLTAEPSLDQQLTAYMVIPEGWYARLRSEVRSAGGAYS